MSKAFSIMRRNRIVGIAGSLVACCLLLICSAFAAPEKGTTKTPPNPTPAAAKKPEQPAATKPSDKPTDKATDRPAKSAPAETNPKPSAAAPIVATPPGVPPVVLSKGHANLCRVKVGDSLPAIELPKAGDTKKTKLSDLYGKAATVVVFWADDRKMSHLEMADLATDVIEPYGAKGVAVVGVAVKEKPEKATAAVKEVGKEIPMLVDDKGTAFAQIGSRRLPRTFVLDANGKILWFDIEYSHATRRELKQALAATVH
jgi:peroxiredoxin